MRFSVSSFSAVIAATFFMATGSVFAGEFSKAWHSKNSAIVLDAYEYTPLDWTKMSNNKRLAGFINKASDGLAPKASCGRDVLCRVKWRRYSAAKELYHTRKVLAKTLGMKWGAYHLARPGNPIKQAEHLLSFARPDKDDLIALDIEHNDPTKWMSLADGEIFARHIKRRTGRYPVLYTNHSTSKFIADHRVKYPLLSRLNLWYARYKSNVTNVFPMGNWDSYTLWQFSSMVNCNNKTCPWRINGAGNWIDVNVVAMSPAELREAWPFAKLRANKPAPVVKPDDTFLMVEAAPVSKLVVASETVAAVQPKPMVEPQVAKTVIQPKAPVVAAMKSPAIVAAVAKPAETAEPGTASPFVELASLASVDVSGGSLMMWVLPRKAPKPSWRPGTTLASGFVPISTPLLIEVSAPVAEKPSLLADL